MTTAELPPPTLRLRIDREALAANWQALDRLSGTASAGAAVKADGYGLGVDTVVPVLQDAGCETFLVAHWSEVPAVLAHVPAANVSVLHGPLSAADVRFAMATGVKPVINSLAQARLWLDAHGGACDLMIDTGINRLGIPLVELGDEMVGRLDVRTAMSHLASADEDSPLNGMQLQRFRDAAVRFPAARLSLANSAGIALGENYAFDLTRPGIALYGGVPRHELGSIIQQVAFLQAAIIQRRTIGAGDSVGYNATFTASRPMEVATVSLGYADGFLRSWAPLGFMISDEARLPVLGRVSMDMIVVDLSEAQQLREGDWLDVPFRLPEASSLSGLSQYELLTTLGGRFDLAS